jgi:hypothetical protein
MHPRRRVRGNSEDEANEAMEALGSDSGPADTRRGGGAHPALEQARLHRDRRAADVTEALGAQAVTFGTNVYLSPDAPGLDTPAGRRLLAHELTHVVQQHEFGTRGQRFTVGERPLIALDLDAMMAVVRVLVDASCNGNDVDMDALVVHAGGRTAGQALPESIRSQPAGTSMLTLRYLFTARCGLVDMRHFFQLLYISWFGNLGSATTSARGATRRGVEHERTAEAASRFGPEDLTSNALGAWTATQLAGFPQRDDLVASIRATLHLCAPVDFAGLSRSSRDALVNFYAAQSGAGEPLNQNTTAVALIPEIPELGPADRSFPFDLDVDDPRRATISGAAFAGGVAGLSGDAEIRRFVDVQRESVLIAIPPAQRVRLCARLLQGWVADEDIDALARLYRLADATTRTAIRAAAPPEALSGGQRTRLRAIYAATV